MAVTSLWRIKGNIGKVVLYVENEDKTLSGEMIRGNINPNNPQDILNTVMEYVERDAATDTMKYVCGINCDAVIATQSMMKIKKHYGKVGGTTAYHGYQSFKEGEVTPDVAHEIGRELATEVWGEKYQVVVATHLDKQNHIHNHFVINTVAMDDGIKFRRTKKDYQKMREVSDRLCKEHGLSVITPSGKGKNYGEWRAEQEGRPTVRGGIREDIDIAIKGCMSVGEFFEAMEEMGYTIDTSGKYPKIKPPYHERFFRFKGLGAGYTVEDIQDRLYRNTYREFPKFEEQEPMSNVLYKYTDIPGSFTIMGFRPLYQTYVYGLKVIKERPSSNKRIHWLLKTEIAKLDKYIFQSELLCSNKIDTAEQLAIFKLDLKGQLSQINDIRREFKNELKRVQRTGDESSINAVKEKLKNCTEKAEPLIKQIKACDEIFERSGGTREKLTELENIYRKEKNADEHISRSSRPNRENVSERR